ILMTSLATMASAVPLALGFGPGAETRAPLARSIIGGILLSTMVTLIIVPIFYLLFDRFGNWMYRLTRRAESINRRERREHREEKVESVNGQVGPKVEPAISVAQS